MTLAALPARRFVFRSVATVAISVCLEADGYSFSASRRSVTIATIGNANVLAMIELHIKAFDKLRRKGLDRRVFRIQISMADDTDRLLLVEPLVHMTAYAGFVAAQLAFYALRLALMADIALKL